MAANLTGKTLLNQFRVVEFIAPGGMGVVYKVWDLHRYVHLAMKVLNIDLADDPTALHVFQREARALSKITHPNIVPFYGIYETNELVFFLEKFIDGPTVKEIISDRNKQPFPINEVLIILKALCAALGYAHSQGVIHCDVKPGNVMIDKTGVIYLTDFGIARHAESTTTTYLSAGTAAYISPEQIRNEPVTSATDVYALGVMIFELFTGQRPFTSGSSNSDDSGQTANERIRLAHLNRSPPNPRAFNPDISLELASVILKALEKNPRQRYESTRFFFEQVCAAIGVAADVLPDRYELPKSEQEKYNPETQGIEKPAIKSVISRLPVRIWLGVLIVTILVLSIFIIVSSRDHPSTVSSVVTTSQSIEPSTLPIQFSTSPVVPTLTSRPSNTPIQKNTFRPTNTPRPTSTSSRINTPRPTNTSGLTDTPWPTNTPRPTNTKISKLYYPLQDCAASHLSVGDRAYVDYEGGANAIREFADTHPADNIIGWAQPGDELTIIGGPKCNYGWLLWLVRLETGQDANLEGWTPETDGSEFWLVLK